jgi:alginate O-acetyltransferase complex protein AlgJ
MIQKSEPRTGYRQLSLSFKEQIENRTTIAVFLCTILMFSLLTLPNFRIRAGTISEEENRTYCGFPHVRLTFDSLRAFPAAFEKFYGDRFAMRQKTIELLGAMKYYLFQITATPYVVAGPDNWLFFRGDGDEYAMRHWPLFSILELKEWANVLEQRRAWLAKRNIKFLFVVVPTKANVYPELVPSAWKPLTAESRAKQLCSYLKQFTKIECIYLEDALVKAKPMGKLYWKTDTHWDPLGAYVGYTSVTEVLRRLVPSTGLVEWKDVVRTPKPSMHGDLLGIAGLGDLISDPYEQFTLNNFSYRLSKHPGNPPPDRHLRVAFAMEQDNPALPTAFFIHDSFLINEVPFFSQSFRRVYYDWRTGYPFRTALIADEHPDVVVQEMTERHLTDPVPINPPELLRH